MKDKAVAELANVVKDMLVEGKGFILEQAPDIIQQLILFKRIEFTFMTIAFVLGFIVFIVIGLWSVYQLNDCGSEGWVIGVIVSTVALLIMTPLFVFVVVPQMIMVWFAPKVYLLEYFCGAIK